MNNATRSRTKITITCPVNMETHMTPRGDLTLSYSGTTIVCIVKQGDVYTVEAEGRGDYQLIGQTTDRAKALAMANERVKLAAYGRKGVTIKKLPTEFYGVAN